MSNQFVDYSQAQIAKSIRLSNAILAQTDSFATSSLKAARALIADSAATAKKLPEVKDVAGFIAFQQQFAQPYLATAKSLTKSALAAGEALKAEFSGVAEENVAEFKTTLGATIDKAVKTAPESVQTAVASAKTSAAKVEEALDVASKNAKLITDDFVKASIAAVESASQAAIAAAAASTKKATA